jgi:hypothetical protein
MRTLTETSDSKKPRRKKNGKKHGHDSELCFLLVTILYSTIVFSSVFIVFSTLQHPKDKTALCQFVKVQDPDNSSQTVYDSWIKLNGSPQVSCNNMLVQYIVYCLHSF